MLNRINHPKINICFALPGKIASGVKDTPNVFNYNAPVPAIALQNKKTHADLSTLIAPVTPEPLHPTKLTSRSEVFHKVYKVLGCLPLKLVIILRRLANKNFWPSQEAMEHKLDVIEIGTEERHRILKFHWYHSERT